MALLALSFGEVKIQLYRGGRRALTDTAASERLMVLKLNEFPDLSNRRPQSSSALCMLTHPQYSACACFPPHHPQNTYYMMLLTWGEKGKTNNLLPINAPTPLLAQPEMWKAYMLALCVQPPTPSSGHHFPPTSTYPWATVNFACI